MSSNRFSKLVLLLVALVLAAGVAGAVSVSGDATPPEAEVGTTVKAVYVFNDLYTDPSYEQWTLTGETELTNVTWTVQKLDQAENVIDQTSADGQSFQTEVNIESDVAQLRVQITGTVPEISNYTYDPAQTFLFAEYRQVRQGGTSSVLDTYETHHYTSESREARSAIVAAETAINQAGGNAQAQATLNNAISAYEASNFGNAVDLANQAEDRASKAQQQSQQTQMLLYAGVGVVVLLVIVGGVFWYRSQQTGSKL